jgi:hypothetical protein
MSKAYMIAATIFTGLALVLGYWCTRIRWAPRIDFDIIGFLWLLQNVAPLMLVAMTFLVGGVAVYCWVRSAVGDS